MIPDFRKLCLFNDICNVFWHPWCLISKSKARGVALILDDASVMANSVVIKGSGQVFIAASKLKLSYEGKVSPLTTVCLNGRQYSVQNDYSLDEFKEPKETPLWTVQGPCTTNLEAQLVVAE